MLTILLFLQKEFYKKKRYEADMKKISPGRTNHNIPLVTFAGITSKLKKRYLHLPNRYNTHISNTLD